MKQELSAKQRAACHRMTDPNFEGDVGDLCLELGLQPATFYKWWDNPAFRTYLQLQTERVAGSALCSVWRALIKKCKTGDVSAIKLYFEMRSKNKSVSKESYSQLFKALGEESD